MNVINIYNTMNQQLIKNVHIEYLSQKDFTNLPIAKKWELLLVYLRIELLYSRTLFYKTYILKNVHVL